MTISTLEFEVAVAKFREGEPLIRTDFGSDRYISATVQEANGAVVGRVRLVDGKLSGDESPLHAHVKEAVGDKTPEKVMTGSFVRVHYAGLTPIQDAQEKSAAERATGLDTNVPYRC